MSWDEHQLAAAFRVNTSDIREYLTDGRRVSFIVERRLKWENPGWQLAPSEGAGYDMLDPEGGMWEVRSVTRGGVYFKPSAQVGSGRSYNEHGFLKKLAAIKGFILSDITTFPTITCYVVPVANVLRWHNSGALGRQAQVTRQRFLHSLANDIRFDEELSAQSAKAGLEKMAEETGLASDAEEA